MITLSIIILIYVIVGLRIHKKKKGRYDLLNEGKETIFVSDLGLIVGIVYLVLVAIVGIIKYLP